MVSKTKESRFLATVFLRRLNMKIFRGKNITQQHNLFICLNVRRLQSICLVTMNAHALIKHHCSKCEVPPAAP